MILGEGARPLVAGVTCGVVGAWLATRLLEQMLWVEATDPLTFVLLAGVLLAVGMAANWVPAMRATRIAPTEALREQ
jgi:ABC-type lipoprotein release transport system permease subunit